MTTKIPRISAKFYTTLSKKVNVADTTATLSLATDLDGDVLPSGRYGFTIDEGNSSVEYIEADLVGTALTNVKRLDPTTLAETTGFVKEHRAGAEVKITDFTVLGRIRNVILGIEDLDDGAPIKYGASPSLSDPLMLATVEYVLSVVNGGAVTFDTQVIAGIAGESISSGQWVYFKESDGRWYLTDANTQSTVKNVRIGMAKGAGTTGNAISGGVFVAGIEKTGTYVAGTAYYLSNTAGALSTTAGEFEALVGIADANGELLFLNIYDPEGTTPEEKDALAGTVGTPNTNNKFVTENNLTTAGTDQSQTTQNSTVEVGSADATTQKNRIAQSFIPTKNKIRGVTLYKSADTGTFAGTVKVALQADSGGNPDGVDLASYTMSNIEWVLKPVGEVEFIFSSEYSSLLNVPNTTYWIVVTTSTSDNSNRINLGFNTAGGYANGTLKYNNTADGWVEITGDDLYFKTLEGVTNQGAKTNSTGKLDNDILPVNYFQQILALDNNQVKSSASTPDGSVFYTLASDNITRYQKDPITGFYQITHRETTNGYKASIVLIGDYIYTIYDGGTNIAVERKLASNLSGGTTMTVPTFSAPGTNRIIAWTNGTNLFFKGTGASDDIQEWSISGTTMTSIASHSDDPNIGRLSEQNWQSIFSNGKKVYYVRDNNESTPNNTATLYEITPLNGTSTTSIKTIQLKGLAYNSSLFGQIDGMFAVPIDNNAFYLGICSYIMDATNLGGNLAILTPISLT